MPQEVQQKVQQKSLPQSRRRKRPKSRYGEQMQAKKALKSLFGVSERQLRKYYKEASASRSSTKEELSRFLEERLDNAVYRAGFATTRASARQLVTHGFFQVNGRKVSIPSYRLRAGDTVVVKEGKRAKAPFSTFPKSLQNVESPSWIELKPNEFGFSVRTQPTESDMAAGIDMSAIIEFLAR